MSKDISTKCDTVAIADAVKSIRLQHSIKSVKAASDNLNAEREKLERLGFNDIEINRFIISIIA